MKAVLVELATSKKFLVFLAGAITLAASKLGLNLDQSTLNGIIALVAAYVVGQGIADHGKEAAKVQAATSLKVAALMNPSGSLEASRIASGTVAP